MPIDKTPCPSNSAPRDFATTQWSIVLTAGKPQHREARAALSQLCESYWLPVYAYARRRTSTVEEAQDATQAFFAELLEKNYLAAATPNRGRFRAFLLTAFKHFLSKQREKSRALKRGGGKSPLSLDFATADSSLGIDPPAGLTPDQLFDRQWAVTLLHRILNQLQAEFDSAGKLRQFDVLRGFMIGDHAGVSYADAAAALQTTESAARQAASRMRRRYRELLRTEIARTVSDPEEVDEEIRNLFAVLEL